MKQNTLKAAMKRGEPQFLIWNQTGSPALAEAAVAAGWRYVLIDTEHGPGGFETTINTVRAVEAAGGEAIVRVPANDPTALKRILDAGALSVMIPMVESGADALIAARSCHYPPRGLRGYAPPIARAARYGIDSDYMTESANEIMVIVQIESVRAVEAIDDIAAVDGIDMLFIGPNDLAGSMGKLERLADPEFVKVMENAEERITRTGKWMGTIPIPGRTMTDTAKLGHRLVAGPSDIVLFMAGAKAAKAELGS
ncbi:aldolase/citrate lyase family protein [Fodinicurvata sp. EGI_FJ10296]|uniref:HpcH/HpaI aldolase family protein n=1 Tax=Fodinicurvata sp. EGI_FJ10296 TaxID=3231908 RepID=UPI003454AB52